MSESRVEVDPTERKLDNFTFKREGVHDGLPFGKLLWFIPSDLRDTLLGDLEEEYRELALNEGVFNTRRWFMVQILVSIPPLCRIHLLSWFRKTSKNILKLSITEIVFGIPLRLLGWLVVKILGWLIVKILGNEPFPVWQ